MFRTVGHFDFHFSNEKVPSNKKNNILEYWIVWDKGKDTWA